MNLSERTIRTELIWILSIGFLLRCFHSDAPLLGTNSWRMCDNAMIARNYAASGMNFFHPRVDWGGASSGIVQTEFPVYQYSVAVLYKVFGMHDKYGRWVSIVMSLASVLLLFMLGRRVGDPRSALWGALFYAILPLNVYYGRAFMGEATMLCCLFGGLYAFDRWLEEDTLLWWRLAVGLIALAALMKIIALWVGLPMLWLAWRRSGWACLRHLRLWGAVGGILVPVVAWYAWSGYVLSSTGLSLMGDWRYGTDKWGDWRLAGSGAFWNRIVFQRIAEKHLSWFGFVIAVAGLLLRRHHRERFWDVCLAAIVIVTALTAPGSYHHEHYQLPFAAPCAMLMGRAFARGFRQRFWKSWSASALAPLLAGLVLSSGWRYLQMCSLESTEDSQSWRLAALIREHTRPGELVVAVDGNDPTVLYHAARRGWVAHADTLVAERDGFIAARAAAGAAYLAARHSEYVAEDRTMFIRRLLARYPVVVDDGANFILRLAPASAPPARPTRRR